MNKISELTKRNISELFVNGIPIQNSSQKKISSIQGKLNILDFLKRIPNLDDKIKKEILKDYSFDQEIGMNLEKDLTAKKFFEHLYTKNDEVFISFLEMCFHPIVRKSNDVCTDLLNKIDSYLLIDGYERYKKEEISGEPIYSWKLSNQKSYVLASELERFNSEFNFEINSEYISKQINDMLSNITVDTKATITKSRDLIESVCKFILEKLEYDIDKNENFPKLVKNTFNKLEIEPKSSKKILNGLNTIANGLSELRNKYGDGHGKPVNFSPLPIEYARLAVNTAATLVSFLYDIFKLKQFRQ